MRIRVGFIGIFLIIAASGCKAKHVATEAVAVEVKEEVNTTAKEAEAMNASAWMAENVVVEKPIIELIDSASGQRVTIRGERLARKQHCISETEITAHRNNNDNKIVSTQTATEQKRTTIGDIGIDIKFIIIATAILFLLYLLKKTSTSG